MKVLRNPGKEKSNMTVKVSRELEPEWKPGKLLSRNKGCRSDRHKNRKDVSPSSELSQKSSKMIHNRSDHTMQTSDNSEKRTLSETGKEEEYSGTEYVNI